MTYDNPFEDPVVRALVNGGAKLGPLPPMRKAATHPLVSQLIDAAADLRDGVTEEQVAERDKEGRLVRTVKRQRTPQMLIAKGNAVLDQIVAAHADMSEDEWLGAVIAAHAFCKAVQPYSKSPQRWARVAKSLADSLTLDGIDVRPPLA
jgi:hypothetical protein